MVLLFILADAGATTILLMVSVRVDLAGRYLKFVLPQPTDIDWHDGLHFNQ